MLLLLLVLLVLLLLLLPNFSPQPLLTIAQLTAHKTKQKTNTHIIGLSERDPFVFPDGRTEEKKSESSSKDKGKGKNDDDNDSDDDDKDEDEEEEEEEDDEEARLLRQKARALKLARFRQWRHPTSDALARLRAVGAFAYAAAGGDKGA